MTASQFPLAYFGVPVITVVSSYVLAFLFSGANTPQLLAHPRADRWHRRSTPNLGGAAIFTSCAVAYLLAFRGLHLEIAASAAAMSVLGFVDDRCRISPLMKFAGQGVIAAVAISGGLSLRVAPLEALNWVLTFLWIVGLTNAFNLIDNMDGLCAGVCIVIGAFRMITLGFDRNWADASIYAVLAGSFLGFLLLNYPPARIFMGDCGSMFAGSLFAMLTISDLPRNQVNAIPRLLAGLLPFVYPIFDTVFVSLLRLSSGRAITAGGLDHSSHHLVYMGASERKTVWLIWGFTFLGCLANVLARWSVLAAVTLGTLLFVTLLGFVSALSLAQWRSGNRSRSPHWLG